MALTMSRDLARYVDQELRSFPLAAGARVFRGAWVETNPDGFLRPVAGDGVFAGLAYEDADNSTGEAGDQSARVYTCGDFRAALIGATQADIGRRVYATDDDTLTFDPQSATPVGRVEGIEATGQIVVRIETRDWPNAERIEHHAASFAPTAAQSGTTFTNRGAAAVITASLPQNAPAGTRFRFVCMADQALRIAPGAAGGIYIKGAKQADNKYAQIADIGDFIELIADGDGDWVATSSIGGADADITIEA